MSTGIKLKKPLWTFLRLHFQSNVLRFLKKVIKKKHFVRLGIKLKKPMSVPADCDLSSLLVALQSQLLLSNT